MKLSPKTFKTVNIKGKEYIEVRERLHYLAHDFDGSYSIETDYQYFPDRKMWVVKAKLMLVWDGGETTTYTGLAQEIESDKFGQVNFSSALENAETSAVGRACAMAGIGIDISIASADEMNKALNRSQENTAKAQAITAKHTDANPVPPSQRPSDPEVVAKAEELNATTQQKAQLLLLLNSEVVTKEEKEAMIVNINKFDKVRVEKAIEGLKKTIAQRRSENPLPNIDEA